MPPHSFLPREWAPSPLRREAGQNISTAGHGARKEHHVPAPAPGARVLGVASAPLHACIPCAKPRAPPVIPGGGPAEVPVAAPRTGGVPVDALDEVKAGPVPTPPDHRLEGVKEAAVPGSGGAKAEEVGGLKAPPCGGRPRCVSVDHRKGRVHRRKRGVGPCA